MQLRPVQGCGKLYSTCDGARKHCRQQHRPWLKSLPFGRPELYCRKEAVGKAPNDSANDEPPPDDNDHDEPPPKRRSRNRRRSGQTRQ